MPMTPFILRFPGLGKRETRVATLPAEGDLPEEEYAFLEYYCDEPGCDCRRVVIRVVERSSPNEFLATMNYGWEKPGYYVKWMGSPGLARDAAGLTLDPMFPQSDLAPDLMGLFEKILEDPAYVERLKRHYAMFKGMGPSHSRDWASHARAERAKRPRLEPRSRRKRP